MNWRRGLIRLWVVLSVVWIPIVVVSLNENIRSVGAPVTLHDGEQAIEFPNNTPREVMKKALVDDYLKKRAASSGKAGSEKNPYDKFRTPAGTSGMPVPAEDLPADLAPQQSRPFTYEEAIKPPSAPVLGAATPPSAVVKTQPVPTVPPAATGGWVLVPVDYDPFAKANDEEAEAIMAGYRPRSLLRTLLSVGLFALLPPIGLMLAGIAAVWVVRGFRGSAA